MTIFPTGTATFTNGSKSVTSVSLSSGTLAFFDKGTQVKVESDPVLDIVEATKAINADSFSLAENWPHATGTYNFYATMTAEGIRAIAENIRTYIGRVQGETAALTRLYDTVQEGIDGTNSGDYFNVLVPSDPDVYSQLYLNDNGAAVLQVEMPTKAALEAATLAAQQSESNASDSETAAAQSESNASDSEVAAEQALFDFTEIYWGEYASEPAQSPNGNPPSAGAFYFNRTSSTAFYYNGSGWVDPIASASVSPVADSVAKRTSTGTMRVADAQNADEAVALGQTGTSYSRNVGTGSGDVAEYTPNGLSGFGYGGTSYGSSTWDLSATQFAASSTSAPTSEAHYGIFAATSTGNIGVAIAARDDLYYHPTGNFSTANWRKVWDDNNFDPDSRMPRSISSGLSPEDYLTSPQTGFQAGSCIIRGAGGGAGANWTGLTQYGPALCVKRLANSGFLVAGYDDELYHMGAEGGVATAWQRFAFSGTGQNVSFGDVTASSLNVSGSKNFRIDNPVNPDEYLYHSAIESDKPRTQYVLHVDVDDSLEATVTLPDWFYPLNGNTCTVFPAPCKHFGQAYGEVVDGVLTLTANQKGKYHVLIMAERCDENVKDWVLTEPKPIEEDSEQADTSTEPPQ